MSQYVAYLADLIVPNAALLSNALLAAEVPTAPAKATGGGGFRDAISITIEAPAVLAEVATVQVAEAETGGTFDNLQRAGADVVIGAGKAVTITDLSFKAIRISLGGAAAAQRTFKVTKKVGVYA